MTEHPTPADSPAAESASQESAPETPQPTLETSAPDVAAPQRALAQVNAPEEAPAPPAAPPEPTTARMRGRRSLPDSPLERAKLEAQSGEQIREASDRTTMVAFGLLFVVPILIILLSLVLLLPFINSQLSEDPSGVDTQSISRGQTPNR